MLSPITQADTLFVRQEMARQFRLGSMFMDAEEYGFFTALLDDIDSFSENGLYLLRANDVRGTDDSLRADDLLGTKLFDMDLFELLVTVDEFEFLSCPKFYCDGLLALDSSVGDILSFVASLPAVKGKRYSLFVWEYPTTSSWIQLRMGLRLYKEGYPVYGFAVMVLGDEK